jgi:Integral peroxisomal membrane peroxin
MTNNFRRFNARIGIVFVFQNQLIRLYNWAEPAHTLSFLAIYAFVCLDPYLLVILPVAVVLLFIMVPAFLTRHPPPPLSNSISSTTPYYSINGPALAPPKTIKPASETSKDFFRNMRDLQNSMADFAVLHDTLIATIAPPTNFSNEAFSSALFLYLCIFTVVLFIAAHLFPWRLILLLGGIAVACSGHPTAQRWLLHVEKHAKEKAKMLDAEANEPSTHSNSAIKFFGMPIPMSPAALKYALNKFSAITLDTAPQIREVEIFELQHRLSFDASGEWKPHLFTPMPYDPLSPVRISGDRPKGTRFFEDVQPPDGWVWEGKKWELDLEAREWVSERLVTGVGFDVGLDGELVGTEFGGWVWDLPAAKSLADVEEMWLAYDEERGYGKKDTKNKPSKAMEGPGRDWEESTACGGRTGEWRRRRWVRLVRRIGIDGEDNDRKQNPKTPTRKVRGPR